MLCRPLSMSHFITPFIYLCYKQLLFTFLHTIKHTHSLSRTSCSLSFHALSLIFFLSLSLSHFTLTLSPLSLCTYPCSVAFTFFSLNLSNNSFCLFFQQHEPIHHQVKILCTFPVAIVTVVTVVTF